MAIGNYIESFEFPPTGFALGAVHLTPTTMAFSSLFRWCTERCLKRDLTGDSRAASCSIRDPELVRRLLQDPMMPMHTWIGQDVLPGLQYRSPRAILPEKRHRHRMYLLRLQGIGSETGISSWSRQGSQRLQWSSSIAFSNRIGRCKPCLCTTAIGRTRNPRNDWSSTPQYLTVLISRLWNQQGEVMQPLPKTKRLNIKAQNIFEQQPIALYCLFRIFVRLCFGCSADLTLKANLGMTALEIARQNGAEVGHISVVDWLKFQGFISSFRLMMQERFSYLRGYTPERPLIAGCHSCSKSVPWKLHGLNDSMEKRSIRHCISQRGGTRGMLLCSTKESIWPGRAGIWESQHERIFAYKTPMTHISGVHRVVHQTTFLYEHSC